MGLVIKEQPTVRLTVVALRKVPPVARHLAIHTWQRSTAPLPHTPACKHHRSTGT
jgi:hypothetical protein